MTPWYYRFLCDSGVSGDPDCEGCKWHMAAMGAGVGLRADRRRDSSVPSSGKSVVGSYIHVTDRHGQQPRRREQNSATADMAASSCFGAGLWSDCVRGRGAADKLASDSGGGWLG